MSQETVVHLLRHGEVHNPEGVLYGRRDGYHLSRLGQQMAERVADVIGGRDIVHVRSSPLERAQQTAAPVARARGLDIVTDPRVIESWNVFEGQRFGAGPRTLLKPAMWRYLYNPFTPSWGEPYVQVVARMMAGVHAARAAAVGHEAVVVSHQLPIWITRLAAEGRRFLHDPRTRTCTLTSLTSLTFHDHHLVRVAYSEPAGDLVPVHARKHTFSSGGDPAEDPS
jgi:broad specificity phosphatase PhoE